MTKHRPHARSGQAADCRARLTQLLEYLDGELPPARSAALARHLADCPCCDELVGSLRRAMAACSAAGKRGLPRDVQRRARMRVKQLLDEKT